MIIFFFFFFDFEFFGRENELHELKEIYNKDGFKFIVVYGRRRVGKSSLIKKFIADGEKPNISFMALEQKDQHNLKDFSEVILTKYDTAKGYLSSFDSYEKAFDYITEQSKDEKLILFIDEYPYLANSNPAISSILQKYMDGLFKSTNLTVILCGSSMSFMKNQVLGSKSPLYGRRSAQFEIRPFDYYDTAKFFEKFSNEEKALVYGVCGGIPLYLNKLRNYNTLEEGIKNEFLKKSGSLYEEPRNLLLQELREPAVYNSIIKSIADGASKLNEIATKTGDESNKVAKYLTSLIDLHLVKKETPVVDSQERKGIYRLEDNMFRFWYRFVLSNNTNIELGMFDYVYKEKIAPALPQYMGWIFEDICKQFLKRKNKQMGLPFVFDEIGRWWGNNPKEKKQEEIDIVAVSNKKAIFGECKWTGEVGLNILTDLQRKADLFNKFTEKHYFIFSKSGFSEELQDIAKANSNIQLITLDDIY